MCPCLCGSALVRSTVNRRVCVLDLFTGDSCPRPLRLSTVYSLARPGRLFCGLLHISSVCSSVSFLCFCKMLVTLKH